MTLAPNHTTPDALAQHLGVSPRTMRVLVKSLGAYRQFGKTMILLPDDVNNIMEATRPCLSKSTSAAKSGTTAEQLPVDDYADLQARRTNHGPKGSRPKPKQTRGKVISMARGRM